ncbi:MAG TPA: carboxypeptidase regulatory-like domain-containing protein [Candidatus Dormibacteraeota bacterium]|nr:carboxypeptidase regulatory-like domain-containing protein [Candidatus Dormibacteraeota bacterium]
MRKALAHLFLFQLIFVGMLRAQTNRASITGTITDTSGAPMAGVEVSATNTETNVPTTAVSTEAGSYFIPNLPPGTYALSFQRSGFKKVLQPSVTLISTQVAGIDVTMQVGAATENITVNAEAPLLDSESVAVGTNISSKAVNDLPLSIYGGGRFIEDFAVALTPGYSPYSSPYGAVVNGSQWFSKDYTIDGTSGTASIRGDSILTGPAMEAVEELQAQTSGLDSASAITSGGVMSFTLKSGTDKFHGSAFGFLANEFLDANTWTNDLNGTPRGRRRAFDYGASLGGPILKQKLFFFGTFERFIKTDFRLGGYSGFVPTTAMLGGDFSALLGSNLCTDPANGNNMGVCGQPDGPGKTFSAPINVQNKAGQTVPLQAGMIFDPTTCNAMGTNCKQFTGNAIDTPISSVAQKINAIFLAHYKPEQSGLTSNNRFPISGAPSETNPQPVVKLDYDASTRDRFSGSWIYINHPRILADSGGVWEAGSTDGGPLSAVRTQAIYSQQYRLSESHTFRPNLLNVFNVTYNWFKQGDMPSAAGNWNSQLGFGSTGASNFPSINFGNAINGFSVTPIGNTFQGAFSGATIITGDTVTWTKGRHVFSFGGEVRAYQVNNHSGQGALNFSFVPNTTDGGFSGFTGFGFASYLLGDVVNAAETTGFNLYGRRKAMSLFAQDSYKITPKLTLIAGLRWQYSGRYHEKYGHWANFDLTQIDPAYGYPGKLVFAKGGGDSFEKKEYWDGFGPQIGFAYAPINKWVVRGSFSLALLPPNSPYFNGVPNGFAPGFKGTNNVTKAFNWDLGYPGKFVPGSTNVLPQNVGVLSFVDPHALMPGFSTTFNLGVEYELTRNMRLEVAYVGNRGHHLPDTALAWNEPSASAFLNVEKQNPGLQPYGDYSSWNFSGSGCTKGGPILNNYGSGPGTYVGLTCPYTGFQGPALAAIAPMPQLATWSIQNFYYWLNYVGLPIGQTSYNSMVVDVVKRTGRGLTMDVNYTYARQRGDTYSAQQEGNGAYTGVQDFAHLSASANSLTGYDLTHIVKGYVTYQLPFGKGQRWASDKGSLVNALVGGWQFSALVGYNSGQPLRVGLNQPFYPVWGNFYPNFNPSPPAHANPSGFSGVQAAAPGSTYYYPYFPQSVATAPVSTDGTVVGFGSGGAYDGALRCPGQANENASLMKYFSMGSDGRYQLSMRVELYNLFNRHYYGILGCGGKQTKLGDKNFAAVTGVQDNPRTGQLAVRFTF